jgi:hypothetical protein
MLDIEDWDDPTFDPEFVVVSQHGTRTTQGWWRSLIWLRRQANARQELPPHWDGQ